jgi:hypothetical protein
MGRGIIAGVACLLLAGTASVCSAGAAGSPAKTCGPSYGKTLIAGRSARVYSVTAPGPLSTEHIFGCLTSDPRAWKLSPLGEEKFGGARLERPILLKAPWAGGLVRSHGIDTYRLAVFARNLHTGAVAKCPAGNGIAPRRGGWVNKVVLAGHGSTAWTGSQYVVEPTNYSPGTPYETGEYGKYAPPAPTRRVLERQVTVCTPTGKQLLDQGDGIDPESLELHGSTLTWSDAGETRSAVLE